jgi:hypothetical protein
MNTSLAEQIKLPAILSLKFEGDAMRVRLSDGRILIVPLAWYPRLLSAKKKERNHFEISPSGYGIHWPDLDEDLSVYGFLFGPANSIQIS